MASEWDVEERQALVAGAIALEAKSKTRKRRYDVAFKALPFDQLDIPNKSASDCQNMLEKLISKVRKFRTLEEVLSDAKSEGCQQDPTLFPDFPKRPDSVYNLFNRSHGKKLRDSGMKSPEVMKACAVKWNSLTDEEKKPFIKKHDKLVAEYEAKLEIFKSNHPDLIIGKPAKPVKPEAPLPCNLFAKAHVGKIQKKNPEMSYEDALKKAKKKYTKRPDSKKVKWIRRALNSIEEYKAQCEKLGLKALSTIVTKQEQNMLDEADGKPMRNPPRNLQAFYLSQNVAIAATPGTNKRDTEKMLRTKFAELPPLELDTLQERFTEFISVYMEGYVAYLDSLEEGDRAKWKPAEAERKLFQAKPAQKRSGVKQPRQSTLLEHLTPSKEKIKAEEEAAAAARESADEFDNNPKKKAQKKKKKLPADHDELVVPKKKLPNGKVPAAHEELLVPTKLKKKKLTEGSSAWTEEAEPEVVPKKKKKAAEKVSKPVTISKNLFNKPQKKVAKNAAHKSSDEEESAPDSDQEEKQQQRGAPAHNGDVGGADNSDGEEESEEEMIPPTQKSPSKSKSSPVKQNPNKTPAAVAAAKPTKTPVAKNDSEEEDDESEEEEEEMMLTQRSPQKKSPSKTAAAAVKSPVKQKPKTPVVKSELKTPATSSKTLKPKSAKKQSKAPLAALHEVQPNTPEKQKLSNKAVEIPKTAPTLDLKTPKQNKSSLKLQKTPKTAPNPAAAKKSSKTPAKQLTLTEMNGLDFDDLLSM